MTVISLGQFKITGLSDLITVIICVAVAELPLGSVAVQVIVFTPSGKVSVKSLVTDFTLQLSLVTGVPNVIKSVVVQIFFCAYTVISAGAMMVGFSLSFTVTEKLHGSEIFLTASFAVNVLVVVPTGKTFPLAIPKVCVMVMSGEAVQLSVAVAAV